MREYHYKIDEGGIKELSRDKIVATLPLVFPKPRLKAPAGTALKALTDFGEKRVQGRVPAIVTWGETIWNGVLGTVKTLREREDGWELDIIVQSRHKGGYEGLNKDFVDTLKKGEHLKTFACAPNGGQEEDGSIKLIGFMIVPQVEVIDKGGARFPIDE